MAKELFENYITAVTSHVKFRFDRYDIGQELREHMEDLYEDLLSQESCFGICMAVGTQAVYTDFYLFWIADGFYGRMRCLDDRV